MAWCRETGEKLESDCRGNFWHCERHEYCEGDALPTVWGKEKLREWGWRYGAICSFYKRGDPPPPEPPDEMTVDDVFFRLRCKIEQVHNNELRAVSNEVFTINDIYAKQAEVLLVFHDEILEMRKQVEKVRTRK